MSYGLANAFGPWRWSRTGGWTRMVGGSIELIGGNLESGSRIVVDGAGSLFAVIAAGSKQIVIQRKANASAWTTFASGFGANECHGLAIEGDGHLLLACNNGLFRSPHR